MRIVKPMLAQPAAAPARTGGCAHQTLARGPALHVQRCGHCDTLSLHLGALTLRIDAASAESLWSTLGEALLALHAQRQEEDERSSGRGERDGAN